MKPIPYLSDGFRIPAVSVARLAACLLLGVNAAGDASAQGAPDVLFAPAVRGGLAVDNCAVWGTNCGWGGAHQFCQSQGYPAARSFQLYRPGRTVVIGSNQVCEGSQCVGFSQVVCIQPTTARSPQTPPSQPGSAVAFLTSRSWDWTENGRSMGTMTFRSDGTAVPSWVPQMPHRWEFASSTQLRVYGDGLRYVTLLTWDAQRGSFLGGRDPRSQQQDQVRTAVRPM